MHSEFQSLKRRIPWMMAGVRAVMGPVIVIGERAGWNGLTLAAIVVTALLSDIYDGVLARRWKCDTASVRLFDSMADIVFYFGCAVALWLRQPHLMRTFAIPIAVVVGLELARFVFDFAKFGKPSSYHSYLAKIWGLVLASALVAAFATKHSSAWIAAAVTMGVLCNLEGLAMSLVMPVWQRDVKTLVVALRMRRIASRRRSRLTLKVAAAAFALFALCSSAGHAQKAGEAIYESGTSGAIANTTAHLIAAPEGLRFEANTPLVIPYDKIRDVSWRKDVREHMGFFPAMFVGMFAARVHIYRLALSYQTDAGVNQAAVFQVGRDDAIVLSALLQTRLPQCKEKGHYCMPLYDQ